MNYLAILVAAVMNMILGYLWYGPIFGKRWMKLTGRTKESMAKEKVKMPMIMSSTFVGAIVMSYVLAVFVILTNSTTALMGAMIGFWAWFGFIATTMISDVLYEKKDKQVALINLGCNLAILVVNGMILAVWR